MGWSLLDISLILETFPQHSKQIHKLFHDNTDFQSLIADYNLCKKNLDDIQKQLKEGAVNVKEYEDVFADLQQELLEFISGNR
jgi:hypothetical protein